jgi:hypothetical protein
VCLECGIAQGVEELVLVRAARRVVAAERRRHIPRDGLGGDPAGVRAGRGSSHPVRNEQDGRHALAAEGQFFRHRQARAVNHRLRVHRAEEKMILIFGTDVSRMRHAEQVQLVVGRLGSAITSSRRLEQLSEAHHTMRQGNHRNGSTLYDGAAGSRAEG